MGIFRRVRELEVLHNLFMVKVARLEAENTMLKGSLTALTHEYQGVQVTLSALLQSGLRVWVTDKRTEGNEKKRMAGLKSAETRKRNLAESLLPMNGLDTSLAVE